MILNVSAVGYSPDQHDPPASQATRAGGGAASRLSVPTGSEHGLHVELAFPALGKAPPTTAENEKDFELDEVDAEVSKKTRPTSVDSTEAACCKIVARMKSQKPQRDAALMYSWYTRSFTRPFSECSFVRPVLLAVRADGTTTVALAKLRGASRWSFSDKMDARLSSSTRVLPSSVGVALLARVVT